MKKAILLLVVAGAAAAAVAVALARGPAPQAGNASSHREAPLISEDPSADNTDLYAFRSPDKPDTFTIVSNWIPGEDPAAGPNYYTFSPSARYNIYIDRNGDGKPDVTFRLRFQRKPGQFFLGDTVQPYNVTKIVAGRSSADRQVVTVEKTKVKVKGKTRVRLDKKTVWQQVSRLGNPLINEAVIPTDKKDLWNRLTPATDKQFEQYYTSPILAAVINKLYNLGVKETDRSDLVAVLLTGLKTPNLNYTGPTEADELRLNLSIPPTAPAKVNRMGVLGGDLAGYPNGRRLEDDVIDINERAVGGVLIGHSLPLGDGVDANDVANQHAFPYQADPFSGFDNTKSPATAKTG